MMMRMSVSFRAKEHPGRPPEVNMGITLECKRRPLGSERGSGAT